MILSHMTSSSSNLSSFCEVLVHIGSFFMIVASRYHILAADLGSSPGGTVRCVRGPTDDREHKLVPYKCFPFRYIFVDCLQIFGLLHEWIAPLIICKFYITNSALSRDRSVISQICAPVFDIKQTESATGGKRYGGPFLAIFEMSLLRDQISKELNTGNPTRRNITNHNCNMLISNTTCE